MIIDNLKNAYLYEKINPKFKIAFDFLKERNVKELTPGKYEIDRSEVFAMVQQYETKAKAGGSWEAHRKYIDVQFIADGIEKMGYSNIDGMNVTKEYDIDDDYLLLEGTGNFLNVPSGFFAVFFPDDAHMPGIEYDVPTNVKKVVIKIKLDD